MSNFKSLQGQDKWVLSVLKNKQKGFFIEIGAHNGIDHSNAYVLEKDFGWQGICIEPHAYSFEEVKKNRSCICENICISGTNGTVKFIQRGRRRQLSGIYNDFADDEILQKAESGHPILEKKSITLLNLLQKHKCSKFIDYLSIDVEGAELDILEFFPFDEYKFLTMTVEHNSHHGKRNIEKKNKIFELLISNGYEKVNSTIEEDWYVYCPNKNSKIINFKDIKTIGNYHRSIGNKIVSTNGCFDILHRGHISFLEKCKSLGDILVVGLNSDESVKSIKGDNRPIMDESSRVSIMSHIDLVDHVCIFEESTPSKMLSKLKTDIHCKGADYKNIVEEMPEKVIIEDNGGRIEIVPLDTGYATTNIVNKIIRNKNNKNVIYTAIIGGFDDLHDPKIVTEGWDYVCFTDDDNLKSDIWQIRKIDCNPNLRNRVIARKYKMLYHKYLKEYETTIWVDGYNVIKIDLNDFMNDIGSLEGYDIVLLKHPRRKCLYDEAKIFIDAYGDSYGDIKSQVKAYEDEGVPRKMGLVAVGLLVRKVGNKKTEKYCESWWEETLKHSEQDQMSFMYLTWKYNSIDIRYIKFSIFNTYFEKKGIHHKK